MDRRSRRMPFAIGLVLVMGILAAPPCVRAQEDEEPDLDVPYVPTNQVVVEQMLKMARVNAGDFLMDLGCGDGRIVVTAAKIYGARAMGVDLDPARIKDSNRNAKKAGVVDLVTFKKADIMETDIRQASVVTLFLLPEVNVMLRPRLFAQLTPGTRVVSNGFDMKDWQADLTVQHQRAYDKVLYFWLMPALVGGTWQWETSVGGKQIPASLRLEQEFQVVQGALRVADGQETPIAKAVLAGRDLAFVATVRIGQDDVPVAYRGTAVGDVIQGTQEWRAGPNAGTYPWVAKREPVDLCGRWEVQSKALSKGSGTLCLRRDGTGLCAAFVLNGAKEETPLAGFYAWGTSVRFEVPTEDGLLVFRGSMGQDAGNGNAAAGDGNASSPWSAKRLAAE